MATTLRPPTAPTSPTSLSNSVPTTTPSNHNRFGFGQAAVEPDQASVITPLSRRLGAIAFLGVRLAIGFEFLWAFLDKTFGFGYSTSSSHAWLNGGSPTKGFLAGVGAGPLQGFFNGLAGSSVVDWLFMVTLLGVGAGLILGIALRPTALVACTTLLLMYVAVWPFATVIGGVATHSTNPIVDDHIVSIVAIVVVAVYAAVSGGPLGRLWAALPVVRNHASLR